MEGASEQSHESSSPLPAAELLSQLILPDQSDPLEQGPVENTEVPAELREIPDQVEEEAPTLEEVAAVEEEAKSVEEEEEAGVEEESGEGTEA